MFFIQKAILKQKNKTIALVAFRAQKAACHLTKVIDTSSGSAHLAFAGEK